MNPPIKILVLPLFYLCNAKCSMCNIWKNSVSPSWGLTELRTVLSQPELSHSVEVVNVTGGEPTLQKNLHEYIKLLTEVLAVVNTVSIQTHGLQPSLVTKRFLPIAEWLTELHSKGKSIHLDINISLDGPAGIHDRVRGVKDAFDAVMDSLQRIKEITRTYERIANLFNCTIVSDNVDHLHETQEIADKCGVEITYTLPQDTDVYMSNANSKEKYRLDERQRRVAAEFLRSLLPRTSGSSGMSKRYCEMLIELLESGRRNMGCPLAESGLFMSPEGSAMPCWRSSELHLGDLRKDSMEDISNSRKNVDYQNRLKRLCTECPSNCYVEWNRRMFARRLARISS